MMQFLMRWLRARATLGWALCKHVMMGPWAAKRSDPTRWLATMGKERLGPTPAANWAHYAGSSRCIGCRQCDCVGTERLPAPSLVIMGAARLPADAPCVADEILGELTRLGPAIAQVCPQNVQAADVVALIRNNERALAAVTATAP